MVHFVTHEIGSLAKPEWRVRGVLGKRIRNTDILDAIKWGKRLAIENSGLIKLLKKNKLGSSDKEEIKEWASCYAVRLEEQAGLDVVYDGEQQRSEMYQYPITHSQGFKFLGNVRSFDNKYYKKAACIDRPKYIRAWHLNELINMQRLTDRQIKIPITGAYTIANWSYDEYYSGKIKELGNLKALFAIKKARRNFILDIAKHLIRPNIKILLENGAKWIQIDEPAATTVADEVPLFVEAFNESVKGLKGEFSVHICYSNYQLLFPAISKMQNCSEYALEFANRDLRTLGIKDKDRPGYQILKLFKKSRVPSRIGLGVCDIHSNFIESKELVRDRILYALKILGNPELINPTPDCGLRTRTWDVSFKKLKAVVDGARLAEKKHILKVESI